MKKTQQPYYFWADLTRVLAICLVVGVHLTKFGGWSTYFIYTLGNLGLPLFVLLSGALLLDKNEPTNTFFSKRMRRILLPWLFWAAATYFLSPDSSSVGIVGTLIGKFTFMPIIIGIYALTPIWRILVKHADTSLLWMLVGGWFFGLSLLPAVINSPAFPAKVDDSLVRQILEYSGYFVLGWLFSQKKWTRAELISLVILAISSCGYLATKLFWGADFGLADHISPLVVVAAVGLFTGLRAVKPNIHVDSKVALGLRKMSIVSFSVYLSHQLVIDQLAGFSWWTNTDFLGLLSRWGLALGLSFLLVLGLDNVWQTVKLLFKLKITQ